MPSSNNGDITLTVGLDTSNAEATAKELEEEVSKIFESSKGDESAKFTALNAELKKNIQDAQALRDKMEAMAETEVPTQEYQEISAQIQKATEEFDRLLIKGEEMQASGKASGAAWDNISYKMEELGNTIRYAEGELEQLVAEGKAFTLGKDSAEYAKMQEQLDRINDKTKVNLVKHRELNKEVAQTPKNLNKAATASDKVKNALSRMLTSIGSSNKGLTKMSSLLGGMKSSVSHLASGFLKWGLGIASVMALIRKLRSAVAEGFKNLFAALPDAPITKQVNNLKNSITQLKNSLAAAFVPVIQAILPHVQKLVDMLIKAVNLVGQFFGAFTGKSTVLRATKVQGDYNNALDKTTKSTDKAKKSTKKATDEVKKLNKQVAKFDELNNINTNEDTPMDDLADTMDDVAEAAGKGLGYGFEEVPIDDKIADWVKKIKDMLKKAWETGDFTEIGAAIGQFIKDALDKIPWDYIQATSKKLGKAFATLLNGFFEVPDFGTTVGKTIAEGLDTIVYFIESFLDNLHGIAIGDFFGELVQGFFDNADWTAIGHTISLFLSTVMDLLIGFLESFDVGSIADALVNMIRGIDWGRLTAEVGLLFIGVIKGAVQLLFGIVGGIAELLGDLFKELGWDCVAGFFYGISEKLQEARAKIQEWFQNIVKTVKETLGIHSPSTVFANIGTDIVMGLFNGIKEKIGSVGELLKQKFEGFKQTISNILTSIGNMVSNKVQSWINRFNEVKAKYGLGGGTLISNYHAPSRVSAVSNSMHHLASGAVIPPNKEFMAVLGDQKSGVNIESPLSTMVEAFNQAGGNRSEKEIALLQEQNQLLRQFLEKEWTISASHMLSAMQRQAVVYTKQSGKPAFS